MLKLDRPHGISIASQSCIGSDPNMVMDSSTVGKDGSGVLVSPKALTLNISPSFKEWETGRSNQCIYTPNKMDAYRLDLVVPCHVNAGEDCALACAGVQPDVVSPGPSIELQAAASKLQKMYRGYRTRRNLADCAVVIEELWWSDFASLSGNSITFSHVGKSESTFSRWARASRKAAMVGKGLSKDLKAQKLALRHWLEAIDPRHRYGHNLSMYYNIWFASESTQPFFYWLDVGDGKELSIDKCPRQDLQRQCIQYLGLKERKAYEVIVKNGKLIYRKNKQLVDTSKGAKWIFVLSTCRTLYVGQKIKGKFQHSSFLAGAATTAAGRLTVKDGILLAMWPYSGHYTPTEENFKSFIRYLLENNVDLTNVKRCDDDSDDYYYYSSEHSSKKYVITPKGLPTPCPFEVQSGNSNDYAVDGILTPKLQIKKNEHHMWDTTAGSCNDYSSNVDTADGATTPKFPAKSSQRHTWTTGAGARIGCVRDYPTDLQVKAMEQVNISPRPPATPRNRTPVPSPRPSPALRLSPRIAHMGLPSPAKSPRFGYFSVSNPRISLTLPELKKK